MTPAIDCAYKFTIEGPDAFAWAFVGVLAAHAAWDMAWAVFYGIFRAGQTLARRLRTWRAARLGRAMYHPAKPGRAA